MFFNRDSRHRDPGCMTGRQPSLEHVITLSPSGREFIQYPSQSVLESGLAAGVSLPYRCSNGSCGECRARIIEGSIHKTRYHDFNMPESDRLRGDFLMCCHSAQENCLIEVTESMSVDDIPLQSLQAKVCHSELLDNIFTLRLKFTRGAALHFLPGQYVRINIPGIDPVLIPIASCPCESSVIEMHLLDEPDEYAIVHTVKQLKSRDKIGVEGPFGGTSITESPTTPQLFIALGLEFRVLQGLIEQLFNLDTLAPIGLIWISSEGVSQYKGNLCRSWADAIDNFYYIPFRSINDAKLLLSQNEIGTFEEATIYTVGDKEDLITAVLGNPFSGNQWINLNPPEL